MALAASLTYSDAEILNRKAHQAFASVLESFGRDAPAFAKMDVTFRPLQDDYEIHVEFHNGLHKRFTIEGRRLSEQGRLDIQHPHIEMGMRTLYSRLFEDHLIECDLRVVHNWLVERLRTITDPRDIAAARRIYDEQADAIRRAHHGRNNRTYSFGVDLASENGDRTATALNRAQAIRGLRGDFTFIDEMTAVDWSTSIATDALPEPGPMIAAMAQQLAAARDHMERDFLQQMVSQAMQPGADSDDTLPAVNSGANNIAIGHRAGSVIGGGVGDKTAQKKGLKLLKEWMTAEQRACFKQNDYFEVIGSDTGKRYRIRHGRQMNIDELDAKGDRVAEWCFLPEGQLVAGDVMLAQKIALENHENEALKIANKTWPRMAPLGISGVVEFYEMRVYFVNTDGLTVVA